MLNSGSHAATEPHLALESGVKFARRRDIRREKEALQNMPVALYTRIGQPIPAIDRIIDPVIL